MINKSVLVSFVLILFASCSTISYWSDTPGNTDYSVYKSYQIDDQCSDYDPGVNPINQLRIKNAIELELRDMGYSRSENPDLNIKFFVKNETKYFYDNCVEEYDTFVGGNQCIEKVYTYEEGTLVIDFIDIRKNEAVWHAGARGSAWDRNDAPDETIKKMVKEMMKEYKTLVKSSSYAMY